MPIRSSLRPPPGQQDQGVRLAAPATVGQVGGTLRVFGMARYLRLLPSLQRAAAARPSARIASFSARISAWRRLRSLMYSAVPIALTVMASAAAAQTAQTVVVNVDVTDASLLGWVSLFVGCQLLVLSVFWLLIVPVKDWAAEWLAERLS